MRNFNVAARFVAFVPPDTSFDSLPQPQPVLSEQTVTDGSGDELRLLVAVFMADMPEVSSVQPGGTLAFSIEPLAVTLRDRETGETVAVLDDVLLMITRRTFALSMSRQSDTVAPKSVSVTPL